jgi:hypothetical protein
MLNKSNNRHGALRTWWKRQITCVTHVVSKLAGIIRNTRVGAYIARKLTKFHPKSARIEQVKILSLEQYLATPAGKQHRAQITLQLAQEMIINLSREHERNQELNLAHRMMINLTIMQLLRSIHQNEMILNQLKPQS